MLKELKPQLGLESLAVELGDETALTPDLVRRVVAVACTRFPAMEKLGKTAGFDALICAGASCDAVLALIELELPQWELRRLAYDGGEWLCSLTNQPNLPASFDDTADASHQILPLAILGAFLEACKTTVDRQILHLPTVRRSKTAESLCCDNFA